VTDPSLAATFGDTAFDVLKSAHVLCAALWVGGGFALNVAANVAFMGRDPVRQAVALRFTEFIGQRIFIPLALVVVAGGFWMVVRYDTVYDFGDFWVSYGLGFFVLTFITGAAFLGPKSARLAEQLESGADQDAVLPTARPFRIVALVDLLLLWSVVVGWSSSRRELERHGPEPVHLKLEPLPGPRGQGGHERARDDHVAGQQALAHRV
jgi:uncharacterized membrane protein